MILAVPVVIPTFSNPHHDPSYVVSAGDGWFGLGLLAIAVVLIVWMGVLSCRIGRDR